MRIRLVDGRVVKHNEGTHTGVQIDADDQSNRMIGEGDDRSRRIHA